MSGIFRICRPDGLAILLDGVDYKDAPERGYGCGLILRDCFMSKSGLHFIGKEEIP